jgi:PAS domain S-box-containing protein
LTPDPNNLPQSEPETGLEEYRWFFEWNPQMTWIAGPDGALLKCGKRGSELSGLRAEDLVGIGWVQIAHPDDVAAIIAARDRSIASGEPFDLEHRVRLADGSYRWFRSRAVPRKDASGAVQRWYGVSEDIHDRKMAELRLAESEARLQLAQSVANFATWDRDLRDDHVVVSSNYWELYGISPRSDVLFHEDWSEFIHAEDRERVLAKLKQCLAGLAEWDEEFRVVWRDGSVHWLAGKGRLFHDEHGKPARFIGVNWDITARKEIEERLRASERLYRAIGESIPYGIWICDPEGRNTYASESFLALVGMTQEQCSGYGWVNALHPDDAEAALPAWEDCVRRQAGVNRELRFRGVDGRYHYTLVRGVPVRDDRGSVICWAGINLDIAELKQTENELQQKTAELSAANQKLEQFAVMLGHDLRAPLRTAGMFCELLARDIGATLGPSQSEYLATVQRAIEQSQSLLTDLLTYLHTGRDSVRTTVDLNRALDQAVLACTPQIDEAHARIIRGPLPTIHANFAQMVQVFQNLLTNAIKYRRSEPVRIEISSERRGNEYVISIRDNGQGFDPKYAERIFEPFRRLHGADLPGTGLGLAICRRILDEHEGRIWAESVPGVGTTFYIAVPVAAASAVPKPPGADMTAHGGVAPDAASTEVA